MPNQPTGYTRSELDLIYATAEAHGKAICICTVALPDGTFPPVPGGGPRPEVARILADVIRDTHQATATANPKAAAGNAGAAVPAEAAGRAGAAGARSAEGSSGSSSARAVAYDRAAYDLEASRRLTAVAADQAVGDTGHDAITAAATEAGRG